MPWSAIAYVVAKEVGKRNRLDNNQPIDKSRFNRTGFPFDKESRRDTQFKFFGYKPKRFISVYAKKPRVRVKVKGEYKVKIDLNKWRSESALYEAEMNHRRNFDVYHQQTQLGIHNSLMGYNQMAAMQQAQSQQFASNAGGLAGSLGSMNGLAAAGAIGLGSALTGGRFI